MAPICRNARRVLRHVGRRHRKLLMKYHSPCQDRRRARSALASTVRRGERIHLNRLAYMRILFAQATNRRPLKALRRMVYGLQPYESILRISGGGTLTTSLSPSWTHSMTSPTRTTPRSTRFTRIANWIGKTLGWRWSLSVENELAQVSDEERAFLTMQFEGDGITWQEVKLVEMAASDNELSGAAWEALVEESNPAKIVKTARRLADAGVVAVVDDGSGRTLRHLVPSASSTREATLVGRTYSILSRVLRLRSST